MLRRSLAACVPWVSPLSWLVLTLIGNSLVSTIGECHGSSRLLVRPHCLLLVVLTSSELCGLNVSATSMKAHRLVLSSGVLRKIVAPVLIRVPKGITLRLKIVIPVGLVLARVLESVVG